MLLLKNKYTNCYVGKRKKNRNPFYSYIKEHIKINAPGIHKVFSRTITYLLLADDPKKEKKLNTISEEKFMRE